MIQNRRIHRIRLIASVAVLLLSVSVLATAADQQVLRDRIASLSTSAKPTVDGAPIAAVPGITKLYEMRDWEPAWTDVR